MASRLFIIENASLPDEASVSFLLASDARFRCENTRWDSLIPARLHQSVADLIVAVAVPEPDMAMSLFFWLRDHPISASTLAVLPAQFPEELLRKVSETADDFVLWPIHKPELLCRLERILGPERHDAESVRSRLRERTGLAQLVGNDVSFVQMIESIPLIASSDAPVLLLGETGTGKELCARAIHHLSRRHSAPFIPADCSTVPEHLAENELFGHARGAFTDAHTDKKGLAAIAEGGTLFLDEVDALSLATQAKLLRFLEEGTYRALGAEHFTRADVRVIAASNRDLQVSIREKQFRSDLYFRLNVLCLYIPPLRERRGDVDLLARHFLESLCTSVGSVRKSLSLAAVRKLESYDWPGNVRELSNIMQRAILFCPGSQIQASHIFLTPLTKAEQPPRGKFRGAKALVIEGFERSYVEDLLLKHHGNVARSAAEAGKDRRTFSRLIKKYNIDRNAL